MSYVQSHVHADHSVSSSMYVDRKGLVRKSIINSPQNPQATIIIRYCTHLPVKGCKWDSIDDNMCILVLCGVSIHSVHLS